MNETTSSQPGILPIEVPPEITEAAGKIQKWAAENGIKFWQLQGVCSRVYALAIQQNVPKLKAIEPRSNGDAKRAQEHNEAVKALRQYVYR